MFLKHRDGTNVTYNPKKGHWTLIFLLYACQLSLDCVAVPLDAYLPREYSRWWTSTKQEESNCAL